MESRIKDLNVTPKDIMITLADGNPGAIRVCCELVMRTSHIDPASALGAVGALLLLDTFHIYGPRIWMLYKDVCGEDIAKVIGLLRAVQLGLLPQSKLNHAIDSYGDGVVVDECMTKVKEQLPNFNL
jgi:hypothetical protein